MAYLFVAINGVTQTITLTSNKSYQDWNKIKLSIPNETNYNAPSSSYP